MLNARSARPRRCRIALAVLAIVLLGAGCSQTDDDPGTQKGADGVHSALERVESGLLDGDGALTCSFLQGSAQRSFNAAVGAASCPDAVASAADRIDDRSKALGDLSDADVDVDGDRAVLSGRGADAFAGLLGSDEVVLGRYQGVWMVE